MCVWSMTKKGSSEIFGVERVIFSLKKVISSSSKSPPMCACLICIAFIKMHGFNTWAQIKVGFDDCLPIYARAIQLEDHGPNLTCNSLPIDPRSSANMLNKFIMKFKNLVF